jgi:3-methyladenine DNA glycosylase AlkD
MSPNIQKIHAEMLEEVNPEKAVFFPKFFKAGPGEYAEGDRFLGISVPNIRKISTRHTDLSLSEVEELLVSEWHEERLLAVLMLVSRYSTVDDASKKEIYEFYISHTKWINNWDLIDSSAEYIVGPYLRSRPEKLEVLKQLADSSSVWERRIAMLATFDYIKDGCADEALVIAEQLINDEHDLIQKAVGWMLREIGKRVDREPLILFLEKYSATMPRTTLRYAIEHLSVEQRTYYLGQKKLQ